MFAFWTYVLIFLPLRLSFHILFILLDCWNVRNKFYLKGCLDFNKNTEVSISQNYFKLHFNLGLLRKPRKHNFRVRIYQKGDLTFILACPRKYIFGVYFETFLAHSYIGKIIEQHETFFLCGSRCLMHEISNPLWFRSNFKIRLKVRESEREVTNETIILTKGAFQYSKNPRIRT